MTEKEEELSLEAKHEMMMTIDYEYLLDNIDITEESTVKDLVQGIDVATSYGWSIEISDLLEGI